MIILFFFFKCINIITVPYRYASSLTDDQNQAHGRNHRRIGQSDHWGGIQQAQSPCERTGPE